MWKLRGVCEGGVRVRGRWDRGSGHVDTGVTVAIIILDIHGIP